MPGQARERLDQARDGLDDGVGHGRTAQPRPGIFRPAGDRAHLLLGELGRGLERVVDRGDDEVLEHLDVLGVDRGRDRS